MLSRTGDNLYWIARYMERAETAARLLERIAFDQVHLIKGDTQHNQRLICLGLPSI